MKTTENDCYANFSKSLKSESNCCLQKTYRGFVTLLGFSFVAKLGAKLKSARRGSLKALFDFFLILFYFYYITLKIVTYVISYTGYASLVKFYKNLSPLRLVWAL